MRTVAMLKLRNRTLNRFKALKVKKPNQHKSTKMSRENVFSGKTLVVRPDGLKIIKLLRIRYIAKPKPELKQKKGAKQSPNKYTL